MEEEVKYLIHDKSETKTKTHIDRKFFSQLAHLLKIAIPEWSSSESGLFLLIALSLISRSVCDLWLIDTGTKIEK